MTGEGLLRRFLLTSDFVLECKEIPYFNRKNSMTESTLTCDRCTAPIPAGASKCPSCGAPLTEAAATGFETMKIGDAFATTKLEMPPEEPVQEAFQEVVEKTLPAPELAPTPPPQPEPARAEPVFTTPQWAESAAKPSAQVESATPKKEWYQNPLTWIIGCGVLFLCCIFVVVIAAVIALLPFGA